MKAINTSPNLNRILFSLLFVLVCACKDSNKNKVEEMSVNTSEEQLYRPNFHFTPKSNWMNDPNGMFYLNGKYHLYFQYYPDDNVWGPMHWGHAVSEDLIVWKEQPIALYPDSLGYIFSGSAVVDVNNTSGFGRDGKIPVVAIFTYHDIKGEQEGAIDFQSQAIAYSLDEGQTWTKYDGNPVLPNPGIKDFRDPKVYWDNEREQWLMVLATYEKSFFYSSSNLKDWELLSDFGETVGEHGGVWECPDIFPMKIEGTEQIKWVLIQSINPGFINGGSGTQYFVGDFDGKTFVLDSTFAKDLEKIETKWLDYGRDNYAGVTWANVPETDGRKLFIGWMSNWDYAKEVPTATWRSAMTIARELKLKVVDGSYMLFSEPVKELDTFKKTILQKANIEFDKTYNITSSDDIALDKAVVEIELSNLSQDRYTFSLENDQGDVVEFGIDNIVQHYFIDRTKSGDLSFSEKFADKISVAPFDTVQDKIHVQILIDKTSIEVFYNNGQTVMTEIFFPNYLMKTLKLISKNHSKLIIEKLVVSELDF
ncbi:levanase/fructan beta-fructosidase [Flavobacteriaceae bacterium MAR_2010_105]|nr:levanase/fructan beta-fructosidase [Flavobacteriaceae bacterium MAR_2010_105]